MLFIILSCVGIASLVLGVVWRLFPQKKIGSLLGYRSTRATKNQYAWDTAQNYAAKILIIVSQVQIALAIGFYLMVRQNMDLQEHIIWLVPASSIGILLAVIISTEIYLSNKFG